MGMIKTANLDATVFGWSIYNMDQLDEYVGYLINIGIKTKKWSTKS